MNYHIFTLINTRVYALKSTFDGCNYFKLRRKNNEKNQEQLEKKAYIRSDGSLY